jgi:hypothetical protein
MNAFGESIANVTRGIAVLTRSFFTFENLATTFKDFASGVLQYGGNFLMAFRELGKQNKPLFFPSSGDPLANERARKKAEAEALKRQKELAALQKKSATEAAKRAKEQAKRDREALALKRAGTIFDMDNIQVVAAMQGRVDAEQRLRLTALLALQTSNAEAAEKLSSAVLALNAPALANLGVMIKSGDTIDDVIEKIIKSQTKISLLGLGIKDIPKAKNPFEDWDSILDRLLAKIGSIRNAIAGFGNGDGMGTTNNGVTSNGNTLTPNGTISGSTDTGNQYITSPFDIFDVGGSNIIANSGMVMTGQASDTPNEAAARQRIADIFATIGRFGAGGAPTNVTVNVSGSVISDRDLQEAVVEGLYEVQKRGQAITISAIGL